MSKQATVHVCQSCGYESVKWLGKCPSCNQWNTLVEQIVVKESDKRAERAFATSKVEAVPFSKVEDQHYCRFSTGIKELDSVLGGGLVPSSLVLLGGDPGIGKSTLLLQLASNVSSLHTVVYASAEESAHQVKLRAERLGAANNDNLLMLAQTDLDSIINQLESIRPKLAVIDSIQTVYDPTIQSAQGSVSQVRECTARLMRFAKSNGIAIVLVGHVTKEGTIAGPKVLEHLVDTVLYFEGEKTGAFRILRAVKNRFGASNEIGIFEMTDKGMLPVENPSAILLNKDNTAAGNAVLCTLEGSRPLLCDVQALVCRSAFAMPRRSGNGFDHNRMAMLLAVLEKRAGYTLYDKDVYLNAAGGMRIDDPAADLSVLAAISSAYNNRPIGRGVALIGEIGLTGEVRSVSNISARISECIRMGIKKIIVPSCNKAKQEYDGADIIYVNTLEAALNSCFDK